MKRTILLFVLIITVGLLSYVEPNHLNEYYLV